MSRKAIWWTVIALVLILGIIYTVKAHAGTEGTDNGLDGDNNNDPMNHQNFATTAGTAHFSLSEWQCKDGTPVPEIYRGNVQLLMEQLEILRSYIGNKPIHINSGYRTPAHNKAVGGATNSMHLVGKAADITVAGMTNDQVRAAIHHLIDTGQIVDGGIGTYTSFTHYDVGSSRRWVGP